MSTTGRTDPEYEQLGSWWTLDAPSLRVADGNHRYVSVWSAGDTGPSVLLVSSPDADHRFWEPLVPLFTETHVVHAMDPRPGAPAPDGAGVRTASAAVGAGLVVAHADGAYALLAAADGPESDSPLRAVLWDPPAAVLGRLPSTIRVVTGTDGRAVVGSLAATDVSTA